MQMRPLYGRGTSLAALSSISEIQKDLSEDFL
nr:MAG TPA: hypothetical protein [Caudoviricetes sp.]